MTKYLLAAAAVAAIAISSAAFAEDGKATAPKAMSDSEMDKVTAAGTPEDVGRGTTTATDAAAGHPNVPAFVEGPPAPAGRGTDTADAHH